MYLVLYKDFLYFLISEEGKSLKKYKNPYLVPGTKKGDRVFFKFLKKACC